MRRFLRLTYVVGTRSVARHRRGGLARSIAVKAISACGVGPTGASGSQLCKYLKNNLAGLRPRASNEGLLSKVRVLLGGQFVREGVSRYL
jgi:hypothetical protein